MKKFLSTTLITLSIFSLVYAGPAFAQKKKPGSRASLVQQLLQEVSSPSSAAAATTSADPVDEPRAVNFFSAPGTSTPPQNATTSAPKTPAQPTSTPTTAPKPASSPTTPAPLFAPPIRSFIDPLPEPAATSSATSTEATSTLATTTPATHAPSTTPASLLPATKEPPPNNKILGITLPNFSFGAPASDIYRTNHLSTEQTQYLLALSAALGLVGALFISSQALGRMLMRRPRYEGTRSRA